MSNLSATTREAWSRTVVDEVYLRQPLIRKLIDRNQVVFSAGTKYKETVQYDDLKSLAQEYKDNTQLTGGSKTVWTTAEWERKRIQIPIVVPGGTVLDNKGGGDGQIVPLEQKLVGIAHDSMRLKLTDILYRTVSASQDSTANWQGLVDGLVHAKTYGGIARTASALTWWNSASLANSWTDQATATVCNINNFRRCIDAVSAFVKEQGDLFAITSTTNYRTLQSQVEAQRVYKEGPLADYGFTSMMIDGVEVVSEPWLTSSLNSSASTDVTKFFMLNLADWNLRLDAARGWGTFEGFTWQGDMQNGTDEYMGRVLLAGNLTCSKPNGSIYLSSFS